MNNLVLTLHVTSTMLVVGTLFVQSLLVVFRLRLSNQMQIEGVQLVQLRVHQLIFYPILFVAMASGIYLALLQERFSDPGNGWLHTKITLLRVAPNTGKTKAKWSHFGLKSSKMHFWHQKRILGPKTHFGPKVRFWPKK